MTRRSLYRNVSLSRRIGNNKEKRYSNIRGTRGAFETKQPGEKQRECLNSPRDSRRTLFNAPVRRADGRADPLVSFRYSSAAYAVSYASEDPRGVPTHSVAPLRKTEQQISRFVKARQLLTAMRRFVCFRTPFGASRCLAAL